MPSFADLLNGYIGPARGARARFAKAVGASPAAVSNACAGRFLPRNAAAWADALGLETAARAEFIRLAVVQGAERTRPGLGDALAGFRDAAPVATAELERLRPGEIERLALAERVDALERENAELRRRLLLISQAVADLPPERKKRRSPFQLRVPVDEVEAEPSHAHTPTGDERHSSRP